MLESNDSSMVGSVVWMSIVEMKPKEALSSMFELMELRKQRTQRKKSYRDEL